MYTRNKVINKLFLKSVIKQIKSKTMEDSYLKVFFLKKRKENIYIKRKKHRVCDFNIDVVERNNFSGIFE